MIANSAVKDSLVVSAGTLTSRALGFVRLALTMYVLVKVANDVFQLANTLPNQVYDLFVSSAFSAVMVPSIVKAQSSKNRDEKISALFVVALSGLAAVTLISTILAPLLVKVMGYSLPQHWFWVAVAMGAWCMPQVFFYGAHALFGGYLNANRCFLMSAWSPVANNIVAIAGLFLFLGVSRSYSAAGHPLSSPENWDMVAIMALCVPATIGIVVQAALLYKPVKRLGFHFVTPVRIRGIGLGKTLKEGAWAMSIVGVTYIGVWALSNVAIAALAWSHDNGVPVASLTERNAASLFYALPMSVLILSVVNVLFTRIVEGVVARDAERVKTLSLQFHQYVGPISVFSVVVLTTASIPLSQSLTLVTRYDAYLIAIVLAASAPNLLPLTLSMLNQRILFACGRTKMVLISNIPGVAITGFGSLAAVYLLPAKDWLVVGLLAYALGTFVTAISMHFSIPAAIRNSLSQQFAVYIRPLLGGLVAAAAGLIFLKAIGFYSGNYLTLIVRGFSVVFVEFAVFWILGMSKQMRRDLVGLLRRRRPA